MNPGDQLAVVCREVNVTGHRRQLRPEPLAQVDEVLQLTRVPVQPVGVIDDDPLDNPASISSSIRSYPGRRFRE
jgi:hypothetical protein